MAKNFKKTAIKTEKNEKKLKKSDFSVIVKKKVISPSLRGAKRRSNLERERGTLDCHDFLAKISQRRGWYGIPTLQSQ